MVGSEHPPNVSGFENLILPWLASLRPGQRIVVAGGVCDKLLARLNEWGLRATVEGRLVLLGPVSDLALSVLIENAACIILPVEYGGGSNLKTAEALLSDRPIVASPASMRGFGEFGNLPGVAIANGAEEFGAAVHRALADRFSASRSESSVAALTWDAVLAPLVALIGELTDGDHAGVSRTEWPLVSTPK
jgi:hypothetical protein